MHNFVHAGGVLMPSNQTGLKHAWLPGDKTRQGIRQDLAGYHSTPIRTYFNIYGAKYMCPLLDLGLFSFSDVIRKVIE